MNMFDKECPFATDKKHDFVQVSEKKIVTYLDKKTWIEEELKCSLCGSTKSTKTRFS